MLEFGNQKKPKILIVDDEEEVLNSLGDLLRKDFHILATSNVFEAQDLLAAQDFFSLVISDQRMPSMTGAEFLGKVSVISPDTARILLTGYSDLETVVQAVNTGHIVHYITKPWDSDKLVALLKPIAERHQLIQDNRRLILQIAELGSASKTTEKRIESLEQTQFNIERENQALKEAYDQLDQSFWHLRKIQEVLPICMECGKVKTSESSWDEVVDFLKKHSMFLSHGYCPECAKKVMHALD